MYRAYVKESEECAKLLLEEGADKTVKNKKGETPVVSLNRRELPEIAAIIEKWGQ